MDVRGMIGDAARDDEPKRRAPLSGRAEPNGEADRLFLLIGHGLQESEARVYLALIEHASLPASRLSQAAGVPRSYLYHVVQDLHEKGLVDILIHGSKREYRARPFSAFVEHKLAQTRERVTFLEQEARSLARLRPPELHRVAPREAGEVRLLIGRKQLAREVDAVLSRARESIAIETTLPGIPRVARHLRNRDAVAAVTIEVFLPADAAKAALPPDLTSGARVAFLPPEVPGRTLMVSSDGRELLLSHPIPDSEEQHRGHDFGIYTTDTAFIEQRVALLRAASKRFP